MTRLLLLLLVGCAATPTMLLEVDDTRRGETAPLEREVIIAEACTILGIECVEAENAPTLLVIAENCSSSSGVCGRQKGLGCLQTAWSEDDPETIAHELGHALGLGHSDIHGNLMHNGGGPGTDLTDRQRRRIERGVHELGMCP